jgi:mono/diheme cytochrome c family protein
MMTLRLACLVAVGVLAMADAPAAEPGPSYARQVRPFLAKYCVECHNPNKFQGGFAVDTYEALKEGGNRGPGFVPGQPNESPVVLLTERNGNTPMPPPRSKQPTREEVALLRSWVAAGAKDDSGTAGAQIPDVMPRVPVVAPVTALAYRPDGKVLAAGVRRQVLLIDPATGDVTGRLPGHTDQVTALAYNLGGSLLAVASGSTGRAGEVRLVAPPSAERAAPAAPVVLRGHRDVIQDLAFSPDGKTLASCGYDRLIKLWDVAGGKELRTLTDHSDAVYGVAFSPDGRLLASGAADRAVKVWEVATGRRLFTLGEPTDWVYAVAWSPDGRHLAAGGVDKSIRVWEVTESGVRLAHAVFAHEAAVLRLAYAADGRTLYSLGEDRTVKAWDAARMVERRVYPRQPESALSLAIRPDHKQLALGRYDGVVLLLDEATGKTQSQPLPVRPKPPQVERLQPDSGQRGRMVRVTFQGKYLDEVTAVTSTLPGLTAVVAAEGRSSNTLQADVTLPALAPAGVYKLGLRAPAGETAQLSFTVDLFAAVPEVEPNDSPTTGQRVSLPVTVVGAIGRPGEVDYYRFEAREGQQVGVQALTGVVGSKLEPVLQLTDATGTVLAESGNGILGCTCPKAGTYALGIRDRDYRGGTNMHYRLHGGDVPVVTAVYPLGLQRGTEADIHLEGVHLGTTQPVRMKVPLDAALGKRLPVSVRTPLGPALGSPSVVVGEFPEVVLPSPKPEIGAILANGLCVRFRQTLDLPVPGTANGRIERAGDADLWRFTARKDQRLIVEVNARRLGSPLDSAIEVLDAAGRPVPRATLRCLAKTYTTFRDHDSSGTGIRMEAWGELAVNDYIWVGNELLRIWELPKNPDDDCQFESVANQRRGHLDTTPTHLSLGTPMYKVAVHPPGTTFPPNGLPVVTLYYRNDDGGPGYGKDSRLFFDPPADGEYQVRITDARGQGGSGYAYRLTVRPPRPSFDVSFSPTAPNVWKGGAVPVTVSATRIDGYDGAIAVQLKNLPPGYHAPETTIPAGENSTTFALSAEATATTPTKVPSLKLVARAVIDGKEVRREVAGGLPKAVEPGDLVTTTEQAEVVVRPGQEVRLTARIERRNGFTGRVPVDVRGLPHGVRVLDIGLNGILITPGETSRTMVIYAEPWVQPTAHPFVVLARSERKNTEHAAAPVWLKVVP